MSCELPSGRKLKLSTRKSEALLAYLALSPGLDLSRERLVNLFWSDRSDEQARNSLRHALSSLKKTLDIELPGLFQIERSSVRLNPEMIKVDVIQFRQLSDLPEKNDLEAAIELYQGEFLEGLVIRDPAGEQWLSDERSELSRIFVKLLNQLGNLQIDQMDFHSALVTAERLVSIDPLQESSWRMLMITQYRSGNRNHALLAYQRCFDLLRRELGVDPEAETSELWRQIKSERPPALENIDTGNDLKANEPSVNQTPGEEHRIAVLPFDNLSNDPEQEYFSDGITESIILNLSLFPGLNVKSRNSSFAFKEQIKSLGEISKELKVDYLVEGSIRKSSEHIRVTVQLIEAESGNQIWGKRYDSELDDLFALEEALSRTVAATVTGQIESDLQRVAIAKGAAGQQSYDLLLSGTYHAYRFNRQDTLLAIEKLNQCLVQDANNVRAHALLYVCHAMDFLGRWTQDYKASFKLAEIHILNALALDPDSSFVQTFYAEYLNFSGKSNEAVFYLDKVLASNPNNPDALAIKAYSLIVQGKFKAALQTAENALQLDSYHPWVEWELAAAQFFLGDYKIALETIGKFRTSPGFTQIYIVVANVKLGRLNIARLALQDFLQECRETMLSMPQTITEWLEYLGESYVFTQSQINRDLIDCMVRAGLDEELAKTVSATTGSVETPSILVLPFENMSSDPEQIYFSDAITESIILALTAAKGLQVKSRHTSFAYRHSALTLDAIGEELGVEYVVEGSVRMFSEQIRITVQLDEVATGNQIWGKRYDSPLEQLFELEEDLVNTIVGTISGRIGHEIRLSSVQKTSSDLRNFDYLARGNYYLERLSAENLAQSKTLFQQCLEIDDSNADAHTGMAIAIFVELFENWARDRKVAKALALQHIETALKLEPDNALTHAYMSEFQLFTRDFELGLFHADRSIELGQHIPEGYSIKAYLLAITGNLQQASKLANLSLQIDPHHFYNGWNAGEALRICGNYQQALDTFHSIPHPAPSLRAEMAACLMGLDQVDRARTEMQKYLKLAREQMVSYPDSMDDWRRYWYENVPYQNEDDFGLFFNQLLQAGLCDEDSAI